MLFEFFVGFVATVVIILCGMAAVAPKEVTDREADDITTNEEKSKKTGNEPTIKCIVDSSKTVVVLFGWAGCKDRYLSKYASYYESSGITTIRFTAPISKIRSYASYRTFARSFHKIFREMLNENQNIETIYFHVFSMNGCSLLAAYWEQLNEFEKGKEIEKMTVGLIFDSCPAFTSPSQSAQAVSFATLPPSQYPGALRESYRAFLYTFFSFHRGVLWLRSLVEKDIYEKHFAYFKMLSFENLPTKQLYIYGPADLVCSEKSIESFMDIMIERGKSVSKLRLLDSLHCQHLRSHPTNYTNECVDFVKSGNLPMNHSRVELENVSDNEKGEEIPEELAY